MIAFPRGIKKFLCLSEVQKGLFFALTCPERTERGMSDSSQRFNYELSLSFSCNIYYFSLIQDSLFAKFNCVVMKLFTGEVSLTIVRLRVSIPEHQSSMILTRV